MPRALGIDHKRKKQRVWMAERRRKWFEENGPCKSCGSWEELELDHIDPTQKASHRVFSWSQVRRDAELVKCQVLCRVCHDKKTLLDMRTHYKKEVHRIHGTNTEYRRGCRCSPCVQAKRVETASYNARIRYARQCTEGSLDKTSGQNRDGPPTTFYGPYTASIDGTQL